MDRIDRVFRHLTATGMLEALGTLLRGHVPTDPRPSAGRPHLRLTALVAVGVFGNLLLGGCVDGPDPTRPSVPLQPPPPSFSQSSDSVHWIGNVLEFTYEGDLLRFERDQEHATEVTMYRNGAPVAAIDIYYIGGNVTGTRIRDPNGTAWVTTDADGTVTNSSGGWGGGGGGGGGGGEMPMSGGMTTMATGGDCQDEMIATAAWAVMTVGGSAVTVGSGIISLKVPAFVNITRAAAAATFGFATATVHSTIEMVICFGASGPDPCDDPNEPC